MAEVKCKVCSKIISNVNSREEYIQCPYCGEIFFNKDITKLG